jgi:hypothetical protein
MTNRFEEASLGRDASDMPPPVLAGMDASRSTRKASVIAGLGLLLMAGLAGFAKLVVVDGLVTPGDAAKTAEDIIASEGMFRFGIASLYLVVILDVVVAWALMRVFSPVNMSVSRLGAWFRLAYAGVFMVALSQLAGIPHLLQDERYSAVFGADQSRAQALLRFDAFNDIWFAGLVLFGAHLLIIGYLAYKSGYVPRPLGILIAIAGFGYCFDTFSAVLSQGSPITISTVTFIGEFLLACWLLIRGRRISIAAAGPQGT